MAENSPLFTAVPDDMPKTALVTGGAKRIGAVLARRLAAEGFAVGIHYHTSFGAAQALAAEIEAGGGKACLFQADLADRESAGRLMAEAGKKLGSLGVLVNNASLFERDRIGTVLERQIEKHFWTNAATPLLLAQSFARQLPEGKKGMIFNVLDQIVFSPSSDFISYQLSKSALFSLTRTLALSLAPSVRVNAAAPGAVLIAPRQSEAHFENLWRQTPLKRKTECAEIAEALMFFVRAASVTGQVIALDSGHSLK